MSNGEMYQSFDESQQQLYDPHCFTAFARDGVRVSELRRVACTADFELPAPDRAGCRKWRQRRLVVDAGSSAGLAPTSGMFTGSYTAANGDVVTVTGGTGRFAGATGGLTVAHAFRESGGWP